MVRIIPSIPAFTIIPDRKAEAGASATGCALVSHACSGNIPALTENPAIIKKAANNNIVPLLFKIPFSKIPPAVKASVEAFAFTK